MIQMPSFVFIEYHAVYCSNPRQGKGTPGREQSKKRCSRHNEAELHDNRRDLLCARSTPDDEHRA